MKGRVFFVIHVLCALDDIIRSFKGHDINVKGHASLKVCTFYGGVAVVMGPGQVYGGVARPVVGMCAPNVPMTHFSPGLPPTMQWASLVWHNMDAKFIVYM